MFFQYSSFPIPFRIQRPGPAPELVWAPPFVANLQSKQDFQCSLASLEVIQDSPFVLAIDAHVCLYHPACKRDVVSQLGP